MRGSITGPQRDFFDASQLTGINMCVYHLGVTLSLGGTSN